MYESDPFAARKAVDERQASAAKRKEEKEQGSSRPSATATKESIEFANAPEVKMASDLRELVESCIKKVASPSEIMLRHSPFLSRLSRFIPRQKTQFRLS